MTLARGGSALKGLSPSRSPRRRGSSFCSHHLGFSSSQGSGEGCSERPGQTPGSSAGLRDTRSDENVFLHRKPSPGCPSGPSANPEHWEPGLEGDAGWGRSSRSEAPAQSSAPRCPPSACIQGQAGSEWEGEPTYLCLSERVAAVPSAVQVRIPNFSKPPTSLLPLARWEKKPHFPKALEATPWVPRPLCGPWTIASAFPQV